MSQDFELIKMHIELRVQAMNYAMRIAPKGCDLEEVKRLSNEIYKFILGGVEIIKNKT